MTYTDRVETEDINPFIGSPPKCLSYLRGTLPRFGFEGISRLKVFGDETDRLVSPSLVSNISESP